MEKRDIISLDDNEDEDDVHGTDSHCSKYMNTENVEELFSGVFTESREDILDVIQLAYGIPPDVMKIICPALGHHMCRRSDLATSVQHAIASTSHPVEKQPRPFIKVEEIEPTIQQSRTNCVCGTSATQNPVSSVSS